MPAERRGEPAGWFAQHFHVRELPRWRAVFALVCAAAAFLCAGGMLEYGTGSPETHGSTAATYWALLFALHVVAFGGAGLLAAFPALTRLPIKLAWLAVLAVLYTFAFAAWYAHQPADSAPLRDWLARWPGYLAAAIATVIGVSLSTLPGDAEP